MHHVVGLHCGQIQGFFGPETPCDNLDCAYGPADTVVVSPNAGGVCRAKQFSEGLKAGWRLCVPLCAAATVQRHGEERRDEVRDALVIRGSAG